MPITERQLKIKRDTFWETAPAYDGRCEIWDALKAACAAAEEDDYSLAQAIIDGANITLPTGKQTLCTFLLREFCSHTVSLVVVMDECVASGIVWWSK